LLFWLLLALNLVFASIEPCVFVSASFISTVCAVGNTVQILSSPNFLLCGLSKIGFSHFWVNFGKLTHILSSLLFMSCSFFIIFDGLV
jgi:hypothetical protein